MPIEVTEVRTKQDRKRFIRLPWHLYKGDPNWVPPLISEMKEIMSYKGNMLWQLGPHASFLAWEDGKVAGRIGVGIDLQLNRAKKRKEGYLTLFESTNNYEVAKALLDAGVNWLKAQGMDSVTGPQSPDNGDDYRGLLIKGFDSPPVLMNSYNPPYYPEFFDRYGFRKQFDRNAYFYDLTQPLDERLTRGVEYAMKRYNFTVDQIDIKHLKREMLEIKQIIDAAMPEEWPDMVPPTEEEIKAEADRLLPVVQPELLYIARSEGKPVGFGITLPDYNQILPKLNGRLFPLGWLKFFLLKKKITGGRSFILFVVPEFHKKGVSAAIYLKTFQAAKRLGYTYGEGSTIHEFNVRMNRDAVGAGGKLYKVYRIYQLNFKD